MGLPRSTRSNPHPNRTSAPGTGVAYTTMDILPLELEMTPTQSAESSAAYPTPLSRRAERGHLAREYDEVYEYGRLYFLSPFLSLSATRDFSAASIPLL